MSTDPSDIRIVLCTCPRAAAADLAGTLVGERLAACVNIVPQVRSIYRWDGAVNDDAEALLVIKTLGGTAYEALEQRLAEAHPYDVPEIIAIPIERGYDAYLAWVAGEVTRAAEE